MKEGEWRRNVTVPRASQLTVTERHALWGGGGLGPRAWHGGRLTCEGGHEGRVPLLVLAQLHHEEAAEGGGAGQGGGVGRGGTGCVGGDSLVRGVMKVVYRSSSSPSSTMRRPRGLGRGRAGVWDGEGRGVWGATHL